jgi:hypothetical protein
MPVYVGDSGGPATKKKPYTADQVAASLAANPNASKGGYEGNQMVDPLLANGQTSSTTGGQNPFETNPGYLASLAAEQSGSQQADAALRAAQEAAIVGYGDPSIAAALGIGNVSENTAAAARANYLAGNSSLARLDKQKGLSEQANINQNAAHGILFSGETGYQSGEIGKRYGNAVYDTQQQLLSGLNAASQQALATKQGLRSNTVGALTNAYDLSVQNPGMYPATGTPGATTPSAVTPAAPSPVSSQLAYPKVGAPVKAAVSRLAKPPVRNPYSTGQKRFG